MHVDRVADDPANPARWTSPALGTMVVPAATRAIAIGAERTAVIVVERRDGRRAGPGEVLRTRHVGHVRLLAGDGAVLARRRLSTSPGAAPELLAHLLDEVRAAAAAAPDLTVGLVQDPDDPSWAPLARGLADLARAGAIAGFHEAVDRAVLRARLDRALATFEPTQLVRDERLDHWDACLDAWDDALAGILAHLRSRGAPDLHLRYLTGHAPRLRYATLRAHGLALLPDLSRDPAHRPSIPR